MPYVVTGSAVAGTHTEGDSFSIRIYVDIVANIVCYYAATGGGATWAQLGTDLTMSGDGKFFAEDEPI